MPPSAMTTEPTMKLARSEARKATISAISLGSAGAADRRLGSVKGEKFAAVFPEMVEKVCHDVAHADRIHAHAMFDCLKRLGTG